MGSIYKRGSIFWIKYYRHGKPYRESSKSDKVTKAQNPLKKREAEITEGKLPGIYFEKITFDDLAKDLLTDYRVNGKDTIAKAERSVKYLKEFYGGTKAIDITTDKVKAYIEKRMEEGLSNASINRELAALKRMFHLANECTPPKVSMIPYIPILKESNVRKGFFEAHEYQALKNTVPVELKPLVTFAYHSGWRKAEILGLTWDKVDLKEGIVRLNPGETKNDEGRILYLNDELMKEMRNLFLNRRLGCSYVFHRDGGPIRDFRGSWETACINAGLWKIEKDEQGNERKVPSKISHDFRRTAIRDMVRSGVSERVAMRISGHRTRSVFDRYNIVSDQDLKEAALKKQAYHEKQSIVIESDQKRGDVIPFAQAQNE